MLDERIWSEKIVHDHPEVASQPGEGEETPEGHVLRYAPGTSQVIGLTVMGARETLERLSITVPETIETTAEGLEPALTTA